MGQSLDGLHFCPIRSARFGLRGPGVKFSASLVENGACLCLLDPLHPPPPPLHQGPHPSRPGANSPLACILFQVSSPNHAMTWQITSVSTSKHVLVSLLPEKQCVAYRRELLIIIYTDFFFFLTVTQGNIGGKLWKYGI